MLRLNDSRSSPTNAVTVQDLVHLLVAELTEGDSLGKPVLLVIDDIHNVQAQQHTSDLATLLLRALPTAYAARRWQYTSLCMLRAVQAGANAEAAKAEFWMDPFLSDTDIDCIALHLSSIVKLHHDNEFVTRAQNALSAAAADGKSAPGHRSAYRHVFVYCLAAAQGDYRPAYDWVHDLHAQLFTFPELLHAAVSIAFMAAFCPEQKQHVPLSLVQRFEASKQQQHEKAIRAFHQLFAQLRVPYQQDEFISCIHPFFARLLLQRECKLQWKAGWLDLKQLVHCWKRAWQPLYERFGAVELADLLERLLISRYRHDGFSKFVSQLVQRPAARLLLKAHAASYAAAASPGQKQSGVSASSKPAATNDSLTHAAVAAAAPESNQPISNKFRVLTALLRECNVLPVDTAHAAVHLPGHSSVLLARSCKELAEEASNSVADEYCKGNARFPVDMQAVHQLDTERASLSSWAERYACDARNFFENARAEQQRGSNQVSSSFRNPGAHVNLALSCLAHVRCSNLKLTRRARANPKEVEAAQTKANEALSSLWNTSDWYARGHIVDMALQHLSKTKFERDWQDKAVPSNASAVGDSASRAPININEEPVPKLSPDWWTTKKGQHAVDEETAEALWM